MGPFGTRDSANQPHAQASRRIKHISTQEQIARRLYSLMIYCARLVCVTQSRENVPIAHWVSNPPLKNVESLRAEPPSSHRRREETHTSSWSMWLTTSYVTRFCTAASLACMWSAISKRACA